VGGAGAHGSRSRPSGAAPGAARRAAGGPPAGEAAVRLLAEGSLELEGRLRGASNTTLRAFVTLDDVRARCVYKPVAGERPLWDFPEGTLAAREVAAYLVSEATGWGVVPPTVLRDGPLGPGACQLWVETVADAAALKVGFVPAARVPDGWHAVADAEDDDGSPYVLAHADDPALARIALLDIVINNADRKGGHVLHAHDGSLRGVDHGVSFHVDEKLRTVLWGFVGRQVAAEDLTVLAGLRQSLDGRPERSLRDRLRALLSRDEVAATVARLDRLIGSGVFPGPRLGRHAMPWPPL
jgi:uncharacterized repeat protein (TIGR03843 family)